MSLIPEKNLLILAMNSRQACFYKQPKRFAELHSLCEIKPEVIVKHNIDIDADRQGRSFDRYGAGRHAMQPATDSIEHHHMVFIRQALQKMQQLYIDSQCEALLIIAGPKLVGYIRKQMDHHKQPEKIDYIVRNPAGLSADELQAIITEYEGIQRLSN